jgi:predicted transcriptional regulator
MSFRLPAEMIEHLDKLAESDRRSRGSVVRIAIEQFLESHPINNKPAVQAKPRKKATKNGAEAK